jgi:hypothetical protein
MDAEVILLYIFRKTASNGHPVFGCCAVPENDLFGEMRPRLHGWGQHHAPVNICLRVPLGSRNIHAWVSMFSIRPR